MNFKNITALFILLVLHLQMHAREGMWVPVLLEQMNYADLKAHGFELTPEDIYSINRLCLADAVVQYNGGCTGSIISRQGLLLTNYHCAYGQVQKHSSLEHDYLKEGFWAKSPGEELPNPGVSVKILRKMIDVSAQVLADMDSTMSWAEREKFIQKQVDSLERRVMDTSELKASIESFYFGHQYYLFLYQVYTDVRLVGVPSSAVGKFGKDTDNWMWPRHSADFALLRIYTSPDGKPANYSADNVPLQPRKYLSISTKGIRKSDPTLVMGYPARTQQYLYSAALENLYTTTLPTLIGIREGYLNRLKAAMAANDKVRIQYARKHDAVSNSWKKWKGIRYGFQRTGAIEHIKETESHLLQTLAGQEGGIAALFDGFEKAYSIYQPYSLASQVYAETLFRIESVGFLQDVLQIVGKNEGEILRTELQKAADGFFKDYDADLGEETTTFLIKELVAKNAKDYLPNETIALRDKHNCDQLVKTITNKSIFTNPARFEKFMAKAKDAGAAKKMVQHDVLYAHLFEPFYSFYKKEIDAGYRKSKAPVDSLYFVYYNYLNQFIAPKEFYPDANRTLRIAYGVVDGYAPADAIYYDYNTSTRGIIEKLQSGNPDYLADSLLLNLITDKQWADSAFSPTFIATNHTTGGNSGSPVLNKQGELIGLNFDRTWESTMSDYYFSDEICRNVMVDVRYLLFLIENYGQCGYLLEEMDIR